MNTQQMLRKIINSFHITAYWLEKFLKIEHAKFNRYIRGINEARFNDVNQWLNILGLYTDNNDIYCIEHINNKNKIPINEENQLFLNAKIDSIQDNLQWIKSNKKIEDLEGHKIFFDDKKSMKIFVKR